MIKISITGGPGHLGTRCLLTVLSEEHRVLCAILVKAACLELGHEETSNGHVERKYTQGKALVFNTVKVMKDQESLCNLRLKKT